MVVIHLTKLIPSLPRLFLPNISTNRTAADEIIITSTISQADAGTIVNIQLQARTSGAIDTAFTGSVKLVSSNSDVITIPVSGAGRVDLSSGVGSINIRSSRSGSTTLSLIDSFGLPGGISITSTLAFTYVPGEQGRPAKRKILGGQRTRDESAESRGLAYCNHHRPVITPCHHNADHSTLPPLAMSPSPVQARLLKW